MKLLRFEIFFDIKSWGLGIGYYHGQYLDLTLLCFDFVIDFKRGGI